MLRSDEFRIKFQSILGGGTEKLPLTVLHTLTVVQPYTIVMISHLNFTLLRFKINIFLHSMEKKSTKVDFSPISCKKAPFYTRNGHF